MTALFLKSVDDRLDSTAPRSSKFFKPYLIFMLTNTYNSFTKVYILKRARNPERREIFSKSNHL